MHLVICPVEVLVYLRLGSVVVAGLVAVVAVAAVVVVGPVAWLAVPVFVFCKTYLTGKYGKLLGINYQVFIKPLSHTHKLGLRVKLRPLSW